MLRREKESQNLQDFIIHTRKTPKREAVYAAYPKEMNVELQACLEAQGIEQLYIHQAEMFERAVKGEHVVITTSTASGKTLGFLLPVLQKILEEPATRAIFIYPTKALASDQYRALKPVLEYFGKERIQAGVYDGDTPSAERTRIRKSANLILTNPEMINGTFLPNHSKFGFDMILTNLKYIVIDELHSYRGAFGAHMANLFRRMDRICRYYQSAPQFLCSSATIANPQELAENICGKNFSLVEQDGSPSPEKTYCIVQPPAIVGNNEQQYGRRSAVNVASDVIAEFIEEGRHFIAFGKSRRMVEVLLKESRDKLDRSSAARLAGYRGGYTPKERKEIEQNMLTGKLLGLVSTNALELGIDIGNLDTTLLVGYPNTRASFWQQTGRAGRGSKPCTNYLILEELPFDQYIAVDAGWLFEQESEHAIVDRNNLLIELAHIRAAAAEMPLSMDDIALFPDLGEVLPVLLNANEVKSLAGKFAWSGPSYPAGDYSLRNMDETRFKLLAAQNQDMEQAKEVTEMDEAQAYRELHPGAVYMHDGNLYEVWKLDLVTRTAYALPFEGNYYTVPAGTENISILQGFKEQEIGESRKTKVNFGDIHVDEMITRFKKLQFHNHQNLGYVELSVPLQKSYDTESTWLELPKTVVSTYRRMLQRTNDGQMILNNHFEGIANALKYAAMMTTMTERDDIDVILSDNACIPDDRSDAVVSLYFYDRYAGGLGYSEKIYDQIPRIIAHAIHMVKNCPCKDGCPACVGDYTLDKGMVLWGLESFYEDKMAPNLVKPIKEVPRPAIQKHFSFVALQEQWQEFCAEVEKNGEAGASFLKTVSPRVQQDVLQLTVNSAFVASWLQEKENRLSIENILRFHVICPKNMKIEIRFEEDTQESQKKEARIKRAMKEQ